ncbi:MAG: hypothetical protein RL138_483, partial [Bacteroidota bacterium]
RYKDGVDFFEVHNCEGLRRKGTRSPLQIRVGLSKRG